MSKAKRMNPRMCFISSTLYRINYKLPNMSEKMVPVRIVIRPDQRAFLEEHEEINISGFVRVRLDELMMLHKQSNHVYGLVEGRICEDGRLEIVDPHNRSES